MSAHAQVWPGKIGLWPGVGARNRMGAGGGVTRANHHNGDRGSGWVVLRVETAKRPNLECIHTTCTRVPARGCTTATRCHGVLDGEQDQGKDQAVARARR
jgi:hypothetical protein